GAEQTKARCGEECDLTQPHDRNAPSCRLERSEPPPSRGKHPEPQRRRAHDPRAPVPPRSHRTDYERGPVDLPPRGASDPAELYQVCQGCIPRRPIRAPFYPRSLASDSAWFPPVPPRSRPPRVPHALARLVLKSSPGGPRRPP